MLEDSEARERAAGALVDVAHELARIADRPADTINMNLQLTVKGVEAKLDGILSVLLDIAETFKRAQREDQGRYHAPDSSPGA